MTDIYNRQRHKPLRQQLRRDQPKAEQLLWARLRGKQMHGVKFRRQFGIGRYVVDFYCPELKLAIEIDGDSHAQEGMPEYDQLRQATIESLGIRFLRFSNEDVYLRLDAVVETISGAVQTPS